jgi:D-aminopeptidase
MTMPKKRARDLGLDLAGTPGPNNAITDVDGVLVGYSTVVGDGPAQARTGVTAILPRGRNPEPQPVWAGQFSLNGNGEMTGTHWIHDGGYFVGPVCITNTHSVGIVHHAATRWMIDTYAGRFQTQHMWAMPVVAETYDGMLNDINGQHVTEDHARDALDSAAGGTIAEGNVGGGTGMICYEFKGGTGTSSRRLELGAKTWTVAALVQANHGQRDWLTILGAPVGREMTEDRLFEHEMGSIIVVLATDAPLSPLSLRHLARRASIGIGRHGTPGGNNSGDIFLAFSTANAGPVPSKPGAILETQHLNQEMLDPLYLAAVESVEEAVINAMLAAETTPSFRPRGLTCRAIDHGRLVEILDRYGRIRRS